MRRKPSLLLPILVVSGVISIATLVFIWRLLSSILQEWRA